MGACQSNSEFMQKGEQKSMCNFRYEEYHFNYNVLLLYENKTQFFFHFMLQIFSHKYIILKTKLHILVIVNPY